jgi:hypothetical protein
MKTERRHELETNELADSLSHWIDGIRPYRNTIIGAIILVVVVGWGGILVTRRNTAQTAMAWEECFQVLNQRSGDPVLGLTQLSEQYENSPVGLWSQVLAADIDLQEGTRLLFSDTVVARSKLNASVEAYREILKRSQSDDLEQRARYGLARATESLCDVSEAKELYQSIVTRWAHCPFSEIAEQRAKDLGRTETKEFYDWFRKQEFGKKFINKPGEKPAFDLNSLGTPDSGAAFPDFGKATLGDSTESSTDDATTEETPADKDDSAKTNEAPSAKPASPPSKNAK